jgi:hypothetical protein
LLALERGRLRWFWVCAVSLWLVKENGAIVSAMLAPPLFLKGRRRDAVLLGLLSVGVFALINGKVMAMMASATGDIGTVASRRAANIRIIGEWRTVTYLIGVLLPFAVIARPCWSWLPAIALMAMNVVISTRSIGFHYECIVIPFLVYGLITALKGREKPAQRNAAAAFAACALLAVFGRSPVLSLRQHWPTVPHRCLAAELAVLPSGGSIATQSGLFPHLMARKDVFLRGLPAALQEDYLVVTKLPDVSLYATPLLTGWLDTITAQRPDYRLLYEGSLLRLWCRAAVCATTNTLAAVRALSNIEARCSTP